jgi:glycosyltransferase involved in cell wall biosynthesis
MGEKKEKVGVGIITCNRLDYLRGLLKSLEQCNEAIDELVIINDGTPINNFSHLKFPTLNSVWLNNPENIGVGKSKNRAMQHLLDKECDYIFIIEDDMIILDSTIFQKYIEAHKKSGIHHFNYGPGSPFNRKQDIQFDLHNRHLLKQDSEPNPKMVLDYKTVKVSLFEHTVAMFSFFTREVLERVGLIDEKFYNAWEHVDHTYRIIKAGYHPPFWWFADLHDSHKYLTEAPGAIDNSSIANKTEQWEKNVYGGREIYKQKHGHYPNQPPYKSKDQVIESIKKLKR